MPNSYVYRYRGGSLDVDDPTYVRRTADDELYEQLRLGEFCYVLTSRQMGKSSLRVQTMNRLQQDGVACATIDLAAIGSQATPAQWYKGILYRLFRSFQLSDSFDGQRLGEQTLDWQARWRDRAFLPVVQRLGDVIEGVLLEAIAQDIVIFIDEIDSVMSIDFSTDDFFAFIRSCYGQRTDNPHYRRLTFCLLGVATPSDLMQDKRRTPFNLGHAIDLTGITFEQAQPILVHGLQGKVQQPDKVLADILAWTEGQPFLTQKICQLVVDRGPDPRVLQEPWDLSVDALIQEHVIENWEAQDEPEHLRTIRDRLLYDSSKAIILLGRYEKILNNRSVNTNHGPDDIDLKLSGLVTIQQHRLMVANPIYRAIFNEQWVNEQLATLWNIEEDETDVEQAFGTNIPPEYTRRVILLNVVMVGISAIALYLHYGPFLGVTRELAFSAHSRWESGLIELVRVVLLLLTSSYMIYFVWRSRLLALWRGQSPKVRWFRRVAMFLTIIFVAISVSHHFWLAPASLRENYHALAINNGATLDNEFVEYILPSLVYFPYSCVIHFFIALPLTLVGLYTVMEDLINNWRRVSNFRCATQENLQKYVSVPQRLKHETIRSQFSKYSLIFSNTATPYSTVFLGTQVLWLFEYRFGMSTLTDPGQNLAIVTYSFSAVVMVIFMVLFFQYQRALNIASNALLYTGDKQVTQFRSEHQVLKLLARIIGSDINLILLVVIVLGAIASEIFALF
ncbi:MAG: AAA-like domain-containing protein [Cyanobacteria bacterium P01_F01_bin.150]